MPTYDYQCNSCGHTFETMQSMKDEPLVVCPECEKSSLRRLISGGAGVIFKGSGFYVNDSRKSSSTQSPDAPKKSTAESGGSETAGSTSSKDTAKTDSSKKSA